MDERQKRLTGVRKNKKSPTAGMCAWERWVYRLYRNNIFRYDSNGAMRNPQDKMEVKKLAEQVARKFCKSNTCELEKQIIKIREKAQNDKQRDKRK